MCTAYKQGPNGHLRCKIALWQVSEIIQPYSHAMQSFSEELFLYTHTHILTHTDILRTRKGALSPTHTQLPCLRRYFLNHWPLWQNTTFPDMEPIHLLFATVTSLYLPVFPVSRSPLPNLPWGKEKTNKNPIVQDAQEWILEFLMTRCTALISRLNLSLHPEWMHRGLHRRKWTYSCQHPFTLT